jgi:TusA-related sulfurtransferase
MNLDTPHADTLENHTASPDGGDGAMTLEVDARGLEPPEPMIRILAAVETLGAGGVLRARTDRRPVYLLETLSARGVRRVTEEQTHGHWIITLRRA